MKSNLLRHLSFFAGLFLFASLSAQRSVKTINDNWEYKLPDAATWQPINLPHTYNDDAYKARNYYKGIALYRRTLKLAEVEQGKRYYLKFDGVNKAADVILNGVTVGSHAGGYTSFCIDVTDYIKADNVIEVTVDNSRKDVTPLAADFTFFGGIYRDVWLISTNEQHFNMGNLGSDGIFITTPAVSEETASVNVVSEITNDASVAKTLEVRNDIYTPDGELLKTGKSKVKLAAGETKTAACLIKGISRPALWTPETPSLYRVSTTLADAKTGEVLDVRNHKIGFRWYSFDADKGFFLNGKPYKLHGFNRHQDQYPMGIALEDEAHRRDVALMKDLGANFIRISHYPQDDAILDACDELGILAWEEIPVVNFVPDTPGYDDNCETNLREMIRQHYNHTCVIAWGYMNEILLMANMKIPGLDVNIDRTVALARRLEAVVHEEDPGRVSVMAFHQDRQYNEVGLNLVDVVGWNLYPGWYSGELKDFDAWCEEQHVQYPDKPIIISEWGAGSDRRLHSDRPRAFDFSIEYQQTYVEHYLKFIEETPYICGATYWNFIDFNVATRQESMPRVNNKGVAYNDRELKDVAYYFKSMWRKDIPVMRIAARASEVRTGKPGEAQYIKVYTNASEVTLYVNGKPLSPQPVENCTAVFQVSLPVGTSTLVARGKHGDAMAEDAMTVTLKPYPDIACGDELAINVGSACFFTSDATHLTWLPDQEYSEGGWGYVGGETASTTSEIFCTYDNPLYQTWRHGNFTYKVDAPAGDYEIELLMTDLSKPATQEAYLLRKTDDSTAEGVTLDINICGEQADTSLSVSNGEHYTTAFKRRYIVHNSAGCITIDIRAKGGEAFLSGLKVRRIF